MDIGSMIFHANLKYQKGMSIQFKFFPDFKSKIVLKIYEKG